MSAWQGTRTLVTGATGFIGAHLVRRLAGLGARVHAVSRRPQEATGHVERWHAADLCDATATASLVEAVQPEVVFHLASEVTGVREPGMVAPTLAGNLGAAVNLLTAVTGGPVRSVVLAGSVEEPRDGQAPSSPYAAAKAAATGYARMFHALWGVPVSVLRVAMVYGPGEPNAARLVPYVTTSLLKGEAPRLTSGARLVTWVYVEDVVDAFVLAGAGGGAAGHVLDIGTPEPVSIRDTAELLAGIVTDTVTDTGAGTMGDTGAGTVGGRARPEYGAVAARPLDRTQRSDIGPAARVLGWRPATTLEAGLRQTVAWYAKRM
ncbi:NAD-dependent epimerase/dehydratase family protein [Nonomuraea mesophila]|uniref:NAD-dependent epimerase/dehydratase family protein n=1 Tax=Nonomuraea mesophila TaxID=2530382 RepID=A0A4R5F1G1_9ACTN|nr:NAD-dependent epimerase/dehydratase family protein [Nonomuraea mesophila]TDE41355.1 NAD-dependent epimerase/dehydratase family protein [Nonomuraea mesophila]